MMASNIVLIYQGFTFSKRFIFYVLTVFFLFVLINPSFSLEASKDWQTVSFLKFDNDTQNELN